MSKRLFVMLILINFLRAEDLQENEKTKFNVVIFLAKTNTDESYTQHGGIMNINFVEKSKVKHCASGEDTSASYGAPENECKQLLKAGIFSLISYCRNVMGMTTAVASQDNDTFSNGLRLKKSSLEDLEVRYHHPHSDRTQQFITKPEHSEVFRIRSKREVHQEAKPEDDSAKWDIFGIVANIKLTFFGRLFDNAKVGVGDQKTEIEQLGKVSENGLFDLVKETLSSVQDGCQNGFLMIVLGGNLTEVSDVYSCLVQSVKHVVENTDEKNTLIVVTGSCPLLDGTANVDNSLIPVFMKGPPQSATIPTPNQLSDVPYSIKNFLTEKHDGCMGIQGLGGGEKPGGTGDMAAGHLGLGHAMYGNLFANMLTPGLPRRGGGDAA